MLDLFTYSSYKDVPKNVAYHYKNGNMNWPMIIYISLVHIVATVGLFSLHKCSRETLLWAFVLWPIRYEIFRSCGYHLSLNPSEALTYTCLSDCSFSCLN